MKSRVWVYKYVVLLFSVVLCIFCMVTFLLGHYFAFSIELVVFALTLALMLIWIREATERAYISVKSLIESLDPVKAQVLNNFPLPAIITGGQDEIVWYNDLFKENVLNGEKLFGEYLHKTIPQLDLNISANLNGMSIEFNKRLYTVFTSKTTQIKTENKVEKKSGKKGGIFKIERSTVKKETELYVSYFIEDTELKQKSKEYDLSRPSVLRITVDGYDEILQNAKESEKIQLVGGIEKVLEDFISKTNGFIEKISKDKYIAIIEERHMKVIIEGRFAVLDRIREISLNDMAAVSLSIGVGRSAPTLQEGEKMAEVALDMALGRGGDQAAVKTESGYEFYGGVSKGVEKRNKVKSRIIAAAITELIENCDNILIMGHRFADLDAVGAAVGLYKSIALMGKNKQAHIVVSLTKNLVGNLIEKMQQVGYNSVFIEPERALEVINKKTLLFVLDTHSAGYVESQAVYKACHNVVVIDHHRKMVDFIDNSVVFYHEPFASSTCEMVTELIQYLAPGTSLGRQEAEALLAGIMLDTKNFVMKAGVRTFEAAAFLRRQGADTIEVKKLFANSIETYQNRTKIVASAQIYRKCAIACAESSTEDLRVVAPQAADELLGIKNVEASFVYYQSGKGVNFSGRSLGAMNVQIIMESLGGGGHLIMAGAFLENCTIEDAKKRLIQAIDDYYLTLPTNGQESKE